MTSSLLLQPQEYSPVNGECWYRFGINTNINPGSFSFYNLNYIVNLNQLSFTGSYIQNLTQVVIPPGPDTSAVYDPHKTLSSQVGYDLTHITQSIAPIANDSSTWIAYDVNYGFVYQPSLEFATVYDTSGFLSFTFSYDITGTFSTNDIINYQLDNSSLVSISQGTASITSIGNSFSFITNVPDVQVIYTAVTTNSVGQTTQVNYNNGSVSPANLCSVSFNSSLKSTFPQNLTAGMLFTYAGTNYTILFVNQTPFGNSSLTTFITLSTNTNVTNQVISNGVTFSFSNTTTTGGITQSGIINSIVRINGTSSTRYAFDGTRQYDQNYNVFDFGIYLANDVTPGLFLTDYLETKQIFASNFETLSFMANNNQQPFFTTEVKTYDVNNNLLNTYAQNLVGSQNNLIWTVGSGPMNLINSSIGLTGVDHYTISISDIVTPVIQPFTYQIVPNCSVYPNVRVMFMNRFGQFDFWNFNKDDQKTINITRTLYRQILPYNYSIGARGDNILSQKVNETHVIQTDWISEYDYNYLIELVSTTQLYILSDFNVNPYPAVVTDTTYETKTVNRDRIFNLALAFQYAYDINTQNN